MRANNQSSIAVDNFTLPFSGIRTYVFQFVFIAATVILPYAAHLSGISVRMFLPMHWPVLLAGLAYGWRAGALVGLFAPVTNYVVSGFPLPVILPSMTMELFTYGLVTGFLRENLKWNGFFSVAAAVIAGRVMFIVSVIIGNVVPDNLLSYLQAALLPGTIAALLQIIFLPILASWWVNKERKS